MFKSKIFFKAMIMVTSIILIYVLSLTLIIVPKVTNKIKDIEEKNAKETLTKIVRIVKNVNKDLDSFRSISLQQQKKELRNLTDSIWSIINAKYEQSKIQNVGVILKNQGLEFEKNLNDFYYKNKNHMSKNELKKTIINFISIYRYNNNRGYFWANDYKTSKMVVHPIFSNLNNKNTIHLKDIDGISIYRKMKAATKLNKGISYYHWINPKSNKLDKKISYSFRFKPFNWLIGTGEYYEVLKQELKDDVIKLISQVRYEEDNYFFLANYNNIMLSHPYLKDKDLTNFKDKKGNLLLPEMIKLAKQKGEGFYSYWINKPNEKKIQEKISFVKNFPAWNIIIGTGIYTNLIDKEVKKRKNDLIKQLRDIIDKTRFAKTGHLYIMTGEGKMLIHPNKNFNERNVKNFLHPTEKTNMYDALKNAYKTKEKSLYYKWNKISDKENYIYEKVSWVEYIPKLDWYIASSVYTEEFEEASNEIRNFILILATIVLFLIITYSFIFFKNILTPITELSKLSLKVVQGDYSNRYKIRNEDSEIIALANQFNEMLETIEYKTKDLEESNDELEQTVHNLKNTQNKLVEAEKMASLGGLVAGVAHEINTPVGIGITASSHFLGLLENIERKYKDDEMTQEEFEEYLKDSKKLSLLINSNLKRTADIINNFKQVTVDQTGELKRVFNVYEYIKVVLLSIEKKINKKNIDIKINCENNLNINSYPGLFAQVISNLIINSYIHGFKNRNTGKIVMKIKIIENNLIIEYKDNGNGISSENLLKIFEPFFTTNRDNGGSGLGLNIIYNIITNNLKGSIKCSSKKNLGVIFDINIPVNS